MCMVDGYSLHLRQPLALCANLGSEMAEAPQIYVGTAGWSYKDWEGIVYPAQIKKSQHPVEFLANYLDVLEINTSFYGHVKPEWGKLWSRMARAVNPAFMFTAKLNRAFTHAPVPVMQSSSAEKTSAWRRKASSRWLSKARWERSSSSFQFRSRTLARTASTSTA